MQNITIQHRNLPGPRNLMNGYKGFPSGYTTFIIQKAVKIHLPEHS